MHIHEFGKKENPVILLLPGTMCYWKGNFGNVIDTLAEDFLVGVVAYTGFDESDSEDYQSVDDELSRIEAYIREHYNGHIRAAYECSLGGTFVTHLVARNHIHMDYGILGSSDLEQAGNMKASLLAALLIIADVLGRVFGRPVETVYDLDCVITSDPITNAPMIVPCGKYHN